MADINNMGQALDWEDEFEVTDEFILLDEGYYPFTVKTLEKERFAGSSKIAACPRAKLTLDVNAGSQSVNIADRILLSTKTQWRIGQFFQSLGFEKNEEGVMQMHWNEIIGKLGWCKIGVREYTNANGDTRQTNEVVAYLRPDEFNKAVEEYNKMFPPIQKQTQSQWSM